MSFSYAFGSVSLTNRSTAPGDGGNPVRSRHTRRMSVRRSASREGSSPLASIRASVKKSIGLLGQARRCTLGKPGRLGATKAQCPSHSAPCSIQRLIVAISSADNFFLDSSGGMRSSGSCAVIFWYNKLSAGLPGTTIRSSPEPPKRPLSTSSRSLALR